MLNDGGYSVVDLSDDEMAKLHVRYMVGGRPSHPLQERLYSFEFPESPGALLRFLNTLGTHWNISLFHYRSHGTDYGRVLAAFELGDHEPDFETRLNELGYDCHDETNNPAFRFFGGLMVRQNLPERLNQRLMQPLFLRTDAQFKRCFLITAL